jgi:hypothetical protein
VTRLDIDEVETGLTRQHRPIDEHADEVVELAVRDQRGVARSARPVEERVQVGSARCRHSIGAGVAPGVGELQAHDLAVAEQAAQHGQLPDRGSVDEELVRIGAALVADRGGLGPHQARTPCRKALPSPLNEIRRPTVRRAVPALHGQDREPVGHMQLARRAVANRDRSRESTAGFEDLVNRHVDPQRSEMRRERPVAVELANLRDHAHDSSRRTMSASTSRSPSGRRAAPVGVMSLEAHPRSWKNIAASWR